MSDRNSAIRELKRRAGLVTATVTIALLAMVLPTSRASSFELVTSNDMLAGNPFTDDFYTSSFGMTFRLGETGFHLQEHMYTDKYAGHRFDETWLTAQLPTQTVGNWNLFTDVGLVHVGRGLFGEEAQNLAHRLVNDDEMFLDYPEESRIFASATMTLERSVAGPKGITLFPSFQISATPDFKHHALGELRGTRRVSKRFTLSGSAGYRFSRSDYALLEDQIDEQGVSFGLSVVMSRRLEVSWTKNRFGTGANHIAINVRIPMGRSRAAQN